MPTYSPLFQNFSFPPCQRIYNYLLTPLGISALKRKPDKGCKSDLEANGVSAPKSILGSLNGLNYERAKGDVGKKRRGREGGGERATRRVTSKLIARNGGGQA